MTGTVEMICLECGNEFPLNEEWFYGAALPPRCPDCRSGDLVENMKPLEKGSQDYHNFASLDTAEGFLTNAIDEIEDRAESRDQEDGERSMARAVAAFNALYSHSLTEEQGWQFMSILKKARSAQGAYREDDHTDDVAYSALAAERANQPSPLQELADQAQRFAMGYD